jgi:hypothetical protein
LSEFFSKSSTEKKVFALFQTSCAHCILNDQHKKRQGEAMGNKTCGTLTAVLKRGFVQTSNNVLCGKLSLNFFRCHLENEILSWIFCLIEWNRYYCIKGVKEAILARGGIISTRPKGPRDYKTPKGPNRRSRPKCKHYFL